LQGRQAANKYWEQVHYLEKPAVGEAVLRQDRSTARRIRLAGSQVIKTLDQFLVIFAHGSMFSKPPGYRLHQ
jgi:hypothetical protein